MRLRTADWSALLADAVTRPGTISEAYATFWRYSTGNQLLALWQCRERRLEPGPINSFVGWQELGRTVKKGETALTLCMPVTIKKKLPPKADDTEKEPAAPIIWDFTRFVFKPRWFVLSQTEGVPYAPQDLPEWKEMHALTRLDISRVDFRHLDGNCQGYAVVRHVAVSPVAVLPWKTLFHELAHVVIGHTAECGEHVDDDITPRNVREVEAEAVALIGCESLGLPGADEARGYIQHWLAGQPIEDKSAQRIFKAADVILKAGRPEGDVD